MKTNDDLIEEFHGKVLELKVRLERLLRNGELTDAENVERGVENIVHWLRTILTQKDAEVTTKFRALCTINEDGDCKYFRDDIHERLLRGDKFVAQDILNTLTPHPTEDTSDKTN